MRILVVGRRGMLGTDLMSSLRPRHDVSGIDLPEIDITDLKQCIHQVRECKPDIIINAAAYTRVDDCETHEKEAFLVNGEGAGNLAIAAEKSGSLLVHYSTDYIFDGFKKEPYLEEDPPNPQSVYGKSKLSGENLIRRNCPDHLILRTSWLFGKNGANFVRTILNMAQQGSPLRVVTDQKGSPTYTKDLASHTLMMIEARCRSTYHLTNTGSCTWFELASRAVEWAGLRSVPVAPVSTSEFKRPAPRPANSVLANARLEREGFPLMRSWQAAVQEYIKAEFRI